MTFPAKPLLSLAAANLLLAFVAIAARAESPSATDRALGGAEAQTATAENEIRVAQGFSRPPGEIGEGGSALWPGEQSEPLQQDPANLLVRIGRLESQMRQLNGQIEQMQFETRRLEEQLKKFEEDVDFRFREGAPGAPAGASPPQKPSEAPETKIIGDNRAFQQSPTIASSRASRRGDAFDPDQNPTAPGAPRPLGSLAPASSAGAAGARSEESSPGLNQNEPGAPLDLTNGRSRMQGAPAPALAQSSAPPAASAPTTPAGTVIAALPPSPKGEFEVALGYFKQRALENAEKGFSRYLEKNPRDKMASEAVYYLGESFYLRGRHREAAEQYLKIPAQYPHSPRAPEALLRLGQSLNALGAKEQACATFGEISRKYPNASSIVKAGAEREAKRAQC